MTNVQIAVVTAYSGTQLTFSHITNNGNLLNSNVTWIINLSSAPGQDGRDGRDGANGRNGQDGADGANGWNGADGQDGQDGADGQDGQDGNDGADAPVVISKTFTLSIINSNYAIDGVESKKISVFRGHTYYFDNQLVNTSHPIKFNIDGNIIEPGPGYQVKIPEDATSFSYECINHPSMTDTIDLYNLVPEELKGADGTDGTVGGSLTLADNSRGSEYSAQPNDLIYIASGQICKVTLPVREGTGNAGDTIVIINDSGSPQQIIGADASGLEQVYSFKNASRVTFMYFGTGWTPVSYYGKALTVVI
ncbi:MAG: hypothetical protein CMP57_02115 [Flavobacteriales bacterium]|nr:hypothetical protein [Flavobacteriales bacterium]